MIGRQRKSERCPNVVVRWKRAVEVGGGEEKRLGGSYGESFLNEGSEQHRAMRGSCRSAQITERHEDLLLYQRVNGILDRVCRIIVVPIIIHF